MLARIVLLVALILPGIARAQPRSAVGQPLPDQSLPVGTVVVRVLAGEPSKPVANLVVTLAIVGGKAVQATTDGSGRAQFAGLAANSRATISVVSTAPDQARSTFVIPDAGGMRLILSTAPWKVAGMPSAREISGKPRQDPDVAAGTLNVRLAYDDLRDPKPPAGIAVTLVGYAADGKITVVSRPSDAKGVATFTGLVSETTAYFVFAILPRGGTVDRLGSEVFVPEAGAGMRILLSSHTRDSKEPPIELEPTVVPKGKVRVEVTGIPDPAAAISIFDAATGKLLAKDTPKSPATHVELDVKTQPGQVLYALTTARNESYRSRPVPAIAQRGTALSLTAVPRLMQKFDLIANREEDLLAVQMRFQLDNNSWLPAVGGLEVPLPVGFKDLVFRDGDDVYAKPSAKGFVVAGALPPGGRAVILGFSIPFKSTRAEVSMDLPAGTLGSRIRVKADPGVSLVDLPATVTVTRTDDHLFVDSISIPRGKSIRFVVIAPKPDPKVVALKKTCRDLDPNRNSALIGKPLVDFTAPQLDGKPFKLSTLKGKLLLVTFNASFNSLKTDQKTLPAFAKAVGAELVTVLSDSDPVEIEKAFGKLSGRVVLDKPATNDVGLGPITGSWGITAVPETYVVDSKGIIRMHVINQRDWSTPSIAACFKASL